MEEALRKLSRLWPDRIVLTYDPLMSDPDNPSGIDWCLILWVEVGSQSSSGSSVYVMRDENPLMAVREAVRALESGELNYEQECLKYNGLAS